jgi:hypothetical protein
MRHHSSLNIGKGDHDDFAKGRKPGNLELMKRGRCQMRPFFWSKTVRDLETATLQQIATLCAKPTTANVRKAARLSRGLEEWDKLQLLAQKIRNFDEKKV